MLLFEEILALAAKIDPSRVSVPSEVRYSADFDQGFTPLLPVSDDVKRLLGAAEELTRIWACEVGPRYQNALVATFGTRSEIPDANIEELANAGHKMRTTFDMAIAQVEFELCLQIKKAGCDCAGKMEIKIGSDWVAYVNFHHDRVRSPRKRKTKK